MDKVATICGVAKVGHDLATKLLLLLSWCSKVVGILSLPILTSPWTIAFQDPLSMGFSMQECWSGLPFPSPGDLPDPEIEPWSPALQADALQPEPPGTRLIK